MYLNSVSHSTGRISWHHILQQESGPSYFTNFKIIDIIFPSFMMFLHQNMTDTVLKWTNAKGRYVYKSDRQEIGDVEANKFIGLAILISFCKPKNENVLQLWSKEDGCPLFDKMYGPSKFSSVMF